MKSTESTKTKHIVVPQSVSVAVISHNLSALWSVVVSCGPLWY